MLFGVHEQYQQGDGNDMTTPQETVDRYPMVAATREFKAGIVEPQNLIPAFNNTCKKVIDAGLLPVWSFKPSKAEVFNGQWRPYIEQLADYINESGYSDKVIIVIWHEPEDDAEDSFPNGTKKRTFFRDGAEFVRYFNQVHDWIKGIDPAIRTSHAALGYGYRPTLGGPRDHSAYVTDPKAWRTKADIDSIDIYSGRSFPLSMTLAMSTAFLRWYTSRGNKPWAVSERGWIADSGQSEDRMASIKAEFDWLLTQPVNALPVFYIVWTTAGTENDPKIILDDNGRAAVNAGFKALRDKMAEPTTPINPPMMTCPLCHGSGEVPQGTTYSIKVG